MKRRFAVVLMAGLLSAAFSGTAFSQEPAAKRPGDADTPPIGSQVQRKPAKPYFIEFRARAAQSYGHTFAVHGRVGQKLTAGSVVGLHPASESPIPWMIGHLILVPSETGASDGDIEDQYIIAKYRIALTEPEYRRLVAHMKQMQASSPVWHAVLYNCNAFVGDIAKFMGLKTPGSTLLMPKEYITELRELNAGATSPSKRVAAQGEQLQQQQAKPARAAKRSAPSEAPKDLASSSRS